MLSYKYGETYPRFLYNVLNSSKIDSSFGSSFHKYLNNKDNKIVCVKKVKDMIVHRQLSSAIY